MLPILKKAKNNTGVSTAVIVKDRPADTDNMEAATDPYQDLLDAAQELYHCLGAQEMNVDHLAYCLKMAYEACNKLKSGE